MVHAMSYWSYPDWTMHQFGGMRTTWGTRLPCASFTLSRLPTTPASTMTLTPSWSSCLSSSRTCAGSKRSCTMRRGYYTGCDIFNTKTGMPITPHIPLRQHMNRWSKVLLSVYTEMCLVTLNWLQGIQYHIWGKKHEWRTGDYTTDYSF